MRQTVARQRILEQLCATKWNKTRDQKITYASIKKPFFNIKETRGKVAALDEPITATMPEN